MNSLVRTTTGLGLGLLLAAGSAAVYSDTVHYRWTNSKGGTVYSDRPPPEGVDYEVVSSGTGLRRQVDGEKGAVPLTVEPSPGNDFEQVDDRSEPSQTTNEVLCEKARMNLVALNVADVVNTRNDQGEVRAMTPEEREVRTRATEAQIEVYCP